MSPPAKKPTARKTASRTPRPSRATAGLSFGYSPDSDEARSSSRVTRSRVSRRTAAQPVFAAQSPGPSGNVSATVNQQPSASRADAIVDALQRRYDKQRRRTILRRNAAVVRRRARRGSFPTSPDVEIRQPSPKKLQTQAERQLGTPDLTEEEPSSSETPSVKAKRDEEHLRKGGILYVPYNPDAPRPVFKTKQTARKRAHSGVFPRMAIADKQEIAKRQKADAVARQAVADAGAVENAEPQPSTSAGPYYFRTRGQKRKYREVSPSSSSAPSEVSVSDDGEDREDPSAVLSPEQNADVEADGNADKVVDCDDDDGSDFEKMDVDPLPSLQPAVPAVPPVANLP
ncbi:serine/arginine repetitive matrix protein 1-like isoform X1 [Paramacrobiotus metropolitanus]|uniref:serine/arginine repetitive matrix protein 1-like isoform X1 n=1 Tax=Paramacrobiotus metropolitanus TaxID=2943436 RepID=UPI0024465A9D|nr:serine/arginine repetitive matrix protein 1-like isoform X1 [Paramacrobiotus metropolitanus]